ncbi:MAG: hypothetical protein HY043_03690 [Verrucomicrobia bacterium]|nr:hypothetical protein [Verrucomicrobiota bacterium]
MNRQSQRGVALVTTLIMLSVVVLMSVAFLAVSRRERASVAVTRDQTTARLMAEAAIARAQSEWAARIVTTSNLLAHDFCVSTNFINPAGFSAGLGNDLRNVSYTYPNGLTLNANDQIRNIANLLYDPRAPVYVQTNTPGRRDFANDFRFYLDFNRNGFVETNGLVREVDNNGRLTGQANFHWGDPEWIGVLQHPDRPHSGSNLFVGRYAFLCVPVGKNLDLNFIHNQAKRLSGNPDANLYYRDQGVGSWELNLAGLLRDLNTNIWPVNQYQYVTNLNVTSRGLAFDDATALLQYRYNNNFSNLSNFFDLFGPNGENFVKTNGVMDLYTDGLQTDLSRARKPWPGSDNPRSYYDTQEMFSLGEQGNNSFRRFTDRIKLASRANSTYDRYTIYRLLSQLGQDSLPASEGKLNLNFNNITTSVTNLIPWNIDPITKANIGGSNFFRFTSQKLLETYGHPFGMTNMMIYPTNYFTKEVHRLLQLSANIYDASSTRKLASPGDPDLPTVFRPVFGVSADGRTNYITGWVEETGSAFLTNPWRDLSVPADRPAIRGQNVNVYGVPLIIGAKKGYPSFNEFAMQTTVQATRRLELRKRTALDQYPFQTNQLFVVGISNLFGVEAWNSYNQVFTRPLRMMVTNRVTMAVLDQFNRPVLPTGTNNFTIGTNMLISGNTWKAARDRASFKLPLLNNRIVLDNAAYISRAVPPRFTPYNTNLIFEVTNPNNNPTNFIMPQWTLAISNRLQYILLDSSSGRVVDFVNLTGLVSRINITRELMGNPNFGDGKFWDTNTVKRTPIGLQNQILASLGDQDADWNSFTSQGAQGRDKQKSIQRFNEFMGRVPSTNLHEFGFSMQAPYTPTRRLSQYATWQANDPLVHYALEDLTDLTRTNNILVLPNSNSLGVTNTDFNLGVVNIRYNPWGGNTNKTASSDPNAFNMAVKDPGVRSSDDWDFPTNKLATLGMLGRVHRGTPWQTVYLKSPVVTQNEWDQWAGSSAYFNRFTPTYGWTHPTNDWILADLFTTAINDNAARGLLSVNQTNIGAWSAALSGVAVLTNDIPNKSIKLTSFRHFTNFVAQPDSPQLQHIVGGVMNARQQQPGGVFAHLGSVLSTPELTVNSPFLNTAIPLQVQVGLDDRAVEAIPQQILSLLKQDDPRVVIYAYGQTLQPAQNSRVVQPGPFFQLCTNYQITGEAAIKTMIRMDGLTNRIGVLTGANAVVESYNVLPAE